MLNAGVGRSDKIDSFQAGAAACQIALDQTGGQADLVIVFASVIYDQEKVLAGVRSVAGAAQIVGCSDAGEITTDGSSAEQVAVMALSSPEVEWVIEFAEGAQKDSFKTGQAVAKKVLARNKNISLFMMLLDGLSENGAAAVRGAQSILGKSFPIIGGSAGDDFKFKKTFQYYNGQVLTDAMIGIGLVGKFSFGVGVRHGWEPIGMPMEVTKSQGGKLVEVDHRPALSIYEDYFGKKVEELIKEPIAKMAYTYPLGMSVAGSPELLIRDVVLANEKGEINCAAEIPQGSKIRLMLGDREKAVQAATEAAKGALKQLGKSKPKAIFVFDCIARKKLLGAETNSEIKAVQKVLGKNVPLIGFYTYGELAPLAGILGAQCCSEFHNETIALLVLGD